MVESDWETLVRYLLYGTREISRGDVLCLYREGHMGKMPLNWELNFDQRRSFFIFCVKSSSIFHAKTFAYVIHFPGRQEETTGSFLSIYLSFFFFLLFLWFFFWSKVRPFRYRILEIWWNLPSLSIAERNLKYFSLRNHILRIKQITPAKLDNHKTTITRTSENKQIQHLNVETLVYL